LQVAEEWDPALHLRSPLTHLLLLTSAYFRPLAAAVEKVEDLTSTNPLREDLWLRTRDWAWEMAGAALRRLMTEYKRKGESHYSLNKLSKSAFLVVDQGWELGAGKY
jgi:hypothetical protein